MPPHLRILVALTLTVMTARLAGAFQFPVVDQTLPNGLRVIVHEDHSAPAISSYVFFRAGSRNEHYGQTGIAHLFEHMMFNGGKKYGPGVFDDLIEGNGGSTNGFTMRDVTAYLNNFPREALPVVLDLESDRMAHLAITPQNLEQERGIVMEERRLRVDDQVSGVMNEELYLHAYAQSPYRWAVIGFMSDLRRITLEQARAFFRTYYAPNNAILVLAGDVEPGAAFALVKRYFGAIPRRQPPAPVDASEPPQLGERRAVVTKTAELPALLIGYRSVAARDPDRPVLDVIEKLLTGGDSARLDEDLLRKHEIATEVESSMNWGIDPELFSLYAQARPKKTAAELQARIDAVLADLGRTPVPADELQKAKNQLEADFLRGMKTVSGKANQLGYFEAVFGDYKKLFELEAAWEAVTAEDVKRVAARYLVPAQRTMIELVPQPKAGATP